jgi:hypothetical protein
MPLPTTRSARRTSWKCREPKVCRSVGNCAYTPDCPLWASECSTPRPFSCSPPVLSLKHLRTRTGAMRHEKSRGSTSPGSRTLALADSEPPTRQSPCSGAAAAPNTLGAQDRPSAGLRPFVADSVGRSRFAGRTLPDSLGRPISPTHYGEVS